MTSRSNRLCELATDTAAPARIIPIASIRMRYRRNGEPPRQKKCAAKMWMMAAIMRRKNNGRWKTCHSLKRRS
jgi:hypothetical protein